MVPHGRSQKTTPLSILRRVLVADDERHTRTSLSIVLRKAGFAVTTAADVPQALQEISAAENAARPFDLLVLDIQMPGGTGLGLIEQLRGKGIALPMVIISGYRYGPALEEYRQEQLFTYLEKPFTPDNFLSHVDRVLEDATATKPPDKANW